MTAVLFTEEAVSISRWGSFGVVLPPLSPFVSQLPCTRNFWVWVVGRRWGWGLLIRLDKLKLDNLEFGVNSEIEELKTDLKEFV